MALIEIIPIDQDQVTALQELGRQAFTETFAPYNTQEDLQDYLNEGFNELKLLRELNNPDSAFFFAVAEGKNVGYLKINTGLAQTELKVADSLEIERIYVLREFFHLKAGQVLLDKAKKIALEKGMKRIWLGVWEENFRALAFYRKNGFVEFDKHIFRMGKDEQTDLMMQLILIP